MPNKSNYKRNNGKRNTKSKKSDYDEEVKKSDPKKSSYNDASWYAQSPQLLKDAASISFNTALGNKIDLTEGTPYPGIRHTNNGLDSIPGVMAFNVICGPGVSKDNSSAVNIAARNIYSFVRHKNSGHANYDSPDLMMYLLAMDSVYAMFNDLKRAYGVLATYSAYNRYMPSAVLAAMGYDFDDLITKMPQMRYYLNAIANKINTLCVPSTMSYMIRHSWMFSNVYLDSNDPKGQMYVFRMAGHHAFDEIGSIPAKLSYIEHELFETLEDRMAHLDSALSNIIESEDFNIMSGDILKAYGESGLFRVLGVDENYTVLPVFNPEVLSQIENITIFPGEAFTLDITQDPNYNTILWDPMFGANKYGYDLARILNVHDGATDPANVMVATRLMYGLRDIAYDNGGHWMSFRVHDCGSEIISGASIYYFGCNIPNTSTWGIQHIDFDMVVQFETTVSATAQYKIVTMLSQFNYHPLVYIMEIPGDVLSVTKENAKVSGFMFGVDHYTIADNATLGRMHQTAILSEFGITG